MKVPFFNFEKRIATNITQIYKAIEDSVNSGQFILKEAVAELEQAIAQFTGAKHCVAASSGTNCMMMALESAGIGRGDEVITPAFSYVSTGSVIAHLAATPVFVDVQKDNYLMSIDSIKLAITAKTRAIIGVHLFAELADLSVLRTLCDEKGIFLLEDSATALGAENNGYKAGRMGHAGIYSFFPAKPLGGIGDGGMLVTDDETLARCFRMLRNHGQVGTQRFTHHLVGYNSRMDEINARYLKRQLNNLSNLNLRRREILGWYQEGLGALHPKVQLQKVNAEQPVPHALVIQAKKRDELKAYLANQGISTLIYYPKPVPLQPAFAYLGHTEGDFPIAESLCKNALSLPMYPELGVEEVAYICESVGTFYAR